MNDDFGLALLFWGIVGIVLGLYTHAMVPIVLGVILVIAASKD